MLRPDVRYDHTASLQGVEYPAQELFGGLFADLPLNVPYIRFWAEGEQPYLVAVCSIERCELACSLYNDWNYVLHDAVEDQY